MSNVNIAIIGITNVIIINSVSGRTRANALNLFIRSARLRLTFKGIPSVVNISAFAV